MILSQLKCDLSGWSVKVGEIFDDLCRSKQLHIRNLGKINDL